MKVGVVAAHPDDEVLGCAGTIAAASRRHEVHILILGEGIGSRHARRTAQVERALKQLQREARAAADEVGARSVRFSSLPDNRFDGMPLLDVVKQVEAWLDAVKPAILYTHHPGDLNVDHGVTFRAVLTATRPVPGSHVKDLYAFEVPSSTEWAFQRCGPVFRPNVFVDISKTVGAKVRALERYTGEIRQFPHPRSAEGIRVIARRWGSVVGVEFAEAFELIRSVSVY